MLRAAVRQGAVACAPDKNLTLGFATRVLHVFLKQWVGKSKVFSGTGVKTEYWVHIKDASAVSLK